MTRFSNSPSRSLPLICFKFPVAAAMITEMMSPSASAIITLQNPVIPPCFQIPWRAVARQPPMNGRATSERTALRQYAPFSRPAFAFCCAVVPPKAFRKKLVPTERTTLATPTILAQIKICLESGVSPCHLARTPLVSTAAATIGPLWPEAAAFSLLALEARVGSSVGSSSASSVNPVDASEAEGVLFARRARARRARVPRACCWRSAGGSSDITLSQFPLLTVCLAPGRTKSGVALYYNAKRETRKSQRGSIRLVQREPPEAKRVGALCLWRQIGIR